MKKNLIAAGAAAALVLTITGCSSSGPNDSGSPSEDDGPKSLTVYAPMEGPRAEYLTEQAKSELGIDVTFVVGGGGDLASRLIAEKNNPQADVVLGLGEAQMNSLAAEGVLEAYEPSWADEVPEKLRSTNEDFTLYTQTPIVIAYNADVLADSDAPRTWEDLADPEYKGKFVFPPLTGQTGQAAVVGLLWPYVDDSGEVSDKGWDVLASVLGNAKPMAAGQNVDWNWVKSGEVPILVNWLGGVETGAKDNGLTLTVVDTKDGTPFVSTGVALGAGTANAEAAQEFLDWFGSTETQVEFVKATNNDTPLNEKALADLPEAKASIEQVSKQDIDWTVVTPHLTEWMQRIELDLAG